MKMQGLLVALLLALLFLATGCSNGIDGTENQERTIIVEERIGNENDYNHFRDISITEQVNKVIGILEEQAWENAEVRMERAPNYKFHIEYIDNEIQSEIVIYRLWISPNKDKIELEIQGEGKYVQLTPEKSAELFEIITGNKLSDYK